MSYLLWQRGRTVGIVSPRLVLKASEVPLLADANRLCERIEQLRDDEVRYVVAAGEEARTAGHAAGYEEGRRQARDELAAAMIALAQETERERERLRGEVAALALEVVRKVVGRVDADDVLVALAQTAARDMLPMQSMALIVHPDRCDAVRDRLGRATGAAHDNAGVRFDVRGDAACTPDTCLIETEHGSVDASLEAQLERLARAWGVASPADPTQREAASLTGLDTGPPAERAGLLHPLATEREGLLSTSPGQRHALPLTSSVEREGLLSTSAADRDGLFSPSPADRDGRLSPSPAERGRVGEGAQWRTA
jgi:type III secretion system HrpE/YscL family protein